MQCMAFQPIHHQTSTHLIHKAAQREQDFVRQSTQLADQTDPEVCYSSTAKLFEQPWTDRGFRYSGSSTPLTCVVTFSHSQCSSCLETTVYHSFAVIQSMQFTSVQFSVSYAASRYSDREASKKTLPKNTSGQLWVVTRWLLSWTAILPFFRWSVSEAINSGRPFIKAAMYVIQLGHLVAWYHASV